jgi:hypothetical protein
MKRKVLNLVLAALFVAAGFSPAASQTAAHAPAEGSAERRAILDALRAGDSGKPVYQVHFIRVHEGWAWVDTTPLDAKTKQATTEGGPNLLHLVSGKWQVMDLSHVPEDPNDPLGPEDASPTFVRNVRKTFKGCPADIFPKPSH